jgi:D-aminopeptidase
MPPDAGVKAGRARIRELGVVPGVLEPGPLNAITDVAGVLVGQLTLSEGDSVRTGVTAVLPHGGNLFRSRVPAGLSVGNGFGKLMGATQVVELGELETPVVLTNTLAVPRAADALLDWTLAQAGNEETASVNPFVGETNDSLLNDIRARVITPAHVLAALEAATDGPVAEGAVGAGTGTVAFGWKGGIGSSSRRLPAALGGFTVGVLVQSNYGGVLQLDGLPVGRELRQHYLRSVLEGTAGSTAGRGDADGSIMIILATDAPLSDRNLKRLAARAMAGLARTGAAMSNGSGDYALAFSTAAGVRRERPAERAAQVQQRLELDNDHVSPLFLAAIEATEEAILNSLSMAVTLQGFRGRRIEALPLEAVAALAGRS